jgi:hypothetical protein
VIIEVRLQHTYSVAGGELATPIREFEDAAGAPWLESIFANGHAETIERGTAASSGVKRLSASVGMDRWLARISVQRQSRECHYRQRNGPEAAGRRHVATTASVEICPYGGSPGNWPSLR